LISNITSKPFEFRNCSVRVKTIKREIKKQNVNVMKIDCQITIDGIEYTAALNDNCTVEDILNMLPLELTLQRYADHEYYSSLPQKPSVNGVPMTSDAHANGIYYYDGWSAFTVLFVDAHIAPYKVVHIGDVNEDITTQLAASGATVKAKIENYTINT
jgi:hypothetical protein